MMMAMHWINFNAEDQLQNKASGVVLLKREFGKIYAEELHRSIPDKGGNCAIYRCIEDDVIEISKHEDSAQS